MKKVEEVEEELAESDGDVQNVSENLNDSENEFNDMEDIPLEPTTAVTLKAASDKNGSVSTSAFFFAPSVCDSLLSIVRKLKRIEQKPTQRTKSAVTFTNHPRHRN